MAQNLKKKYNALTVIGKNGTATFFRRTYFRQDSFQKDTFQMDTFQMGHILDFIKSGHFLDSVSRNRKAENNKLIVQFVKLLL